MGRGSKAVFGMFAATIALIILITYHTYSTDATSSAHITVVEMRSRRPLHLNLPEPRLTSLSKTAIAPQASAPALQSIAAVVAPVIAPALDAERCKLWCDRFWSTWCSAIRECDVAFPASVVQGMIEGGFNALASIQALNATGALKSSDVPKAINWALQQSGKERGLAEFKSEREPRIYEHVDFDGYALRWGDKHRTATAEECASKCQAWEPVAPSWFVCNIFVFCGKAKCFAPAALPPGDMTGQCWMKHQDEPTKPQYNMKGRFSDAYRKTHPTAPEWVDWDAGVIVPKGAQVSLDAPSARANWR